MAPPKINIRPPKLFPNFFKFFQSNRNLSSKKKSPIDIYYCNQIKLKLAIKKKTFILHPQVKKARLLIFFPPLKHCQPSLAPNPYSNKTKHSSVSSLMPPLLHTVRKKKKKKSDLFFNPLCDAATTTKKLIQLFTKNFLRKVHQCLYIEIF